jgi:hypothetical protein
MSINFPNSPSNGQQLTSSGKTYTYNSSKAAWKANLAAGFDSGQVVNILNQNAIDSAVVNSVVSNSAEVLDSSQVVSLISTNSNKVYTVADLTALGAVTGMATGDQALVTSTNKLFMYNSTGWYLIATITNGSPSAISNVDSSYTLATDGTAIVVNAVATDPEGATLTWSSSTSGLGTSATIAQGTGDSSNYFTVTPSTNDSDAGTFTLTIAATDGVNGAVNFPASFTLAFAVDWSTLSQAQKVTASDAANNDFFGNVVDMDGDYAVVGARGNKAAYIFYYNGSTWSEQQKIQETTFGSNFGHAVSISGDTVVIGSNNEDVNSPDGTKAYVYTRSGTTWSLQQKVDPSQAIQANFFGHQRTMKLDKSNSNQFIAGAYGEDQNYSDEGAVYIFTRSGTTWSEQQRIIPADAAINGNYGVTVDIAGDYAVFGGRPGNNFAVYVWTRSGTTWSQQAALTQPSGHTNSQYAYHSGLSINSAGDTIAVGAYGNTSTQAGKVFIFTRSGTTWTNQAVIQPSDTANGNFFGWECRLDTTGDTLVVGAKLASTGGKVYVFTRSGTSWTEQKDFTASDVAANWEFGEDVAIDGSTGKIVVGARQYSSSASGQGAAYVFNT